MRIIVFEDPSVDQLNPITTGRPAYAITCGGYRLVDWLQQLDVPLQAIVRRHLLEIEQLDRPSLFGDHASGNEATLLINARVVPSVDVFRVLQKLTTSGRPGVVRHNSQIAAVVLPPDAPTPVDGLEVDSVARYFDYAGVASLKSLDVKLPLLDYPHDVIGQHVAIMRESLEYRLANGNYREIAEGVYAAAGAKLADYVVTNTSDGPILLDENATVGPHSFINGPAYLGPRCKVIEHASIKDAVVLGHTTKIGGEIEGSIIEPYTNKQHYGFLGHSYLGSWINLGAGTCNSDLKNTYGTVNMEYPEGKVETGMQFVGCIIGDYAKTAINTGIFTGKTIGACSMLYGFITTNVPSFVNYARLFGQVTEIPPEVMAPTQQRMFGRRKVPQRPCDIQLLKDMFELTRIERQMSGDPPIL